MSFFVELVSFVLGVACTRMSEILVLFFGGLRFGGVYVYRRENSESYIRWYVRNRM